jgi:hypothetical protein
VTIRAKEFAFMGPRTIAAGQTTFRLVNDGQVAHHLTIFRVSPGRSLADAQAAIRSKSPRPAWLTAVGGTNAAVPGATSDATLTLEPGSYILACILASPGDTMPHSMRGMVAHLTVTANGVRQEHAASVPTPVADIHLDLKDYGFILSKPITAGRHTFHVMNDGTQDHEAVMLQLAPGKRLSDFFSWAMHGAKGPPPATFMNGVATMARGRTAIFTNDFATGAYAITCFVDAPDKKPHFAHGMTLEFDVK